MPDPALVHTDSDTRVAFGTKPDLLVGRSPDADLPVLDVTCSRRQFRVRRQAGEYILEPLSANTATYHNQTQVTAPTPLADGAVIHAGASTFRLAVGRHPAPPAPVADTRRTLVGSSPAGAVEGASPVRLGGHRLVLGRDPGTGGVILPHPLVSRRHTVIEPAGRGFAIKDLGSSNGTFVDGQRLGAGLLLTPGCRVQVGPFAFTYSGRSLDPTGVKPLVSSAPAGGRLVAHQLRCEAGGQVRLADVSLAVPGGQFVAVVGPSGCGKSTLLKVLSGVFPPTAGRVAFDGCDLYHAPAGANRRVAVVPQREILPAGLTVAAALRTTAALRLPPDTSTAEIDRIVGSVLGLVGLADRRDVRIARLSGGQLKRTALANELLTDPGLLLLDEVTSGLDEQADRQLMALFRELARGGRAVVAVTHSLTHVADYCHAVVVLTPGGRLAFQGSPAEALRYFQIDRLGDVYDALGQQTPDEWAARTGGRPDRLPPPPALPAGPAPREIADSPAAIRHQTPTFVQRTARVLASDLTAVAVTALQPLLTGLLVVAVFGDVRTANQPAATAAAARGVLFVLAVTAFWLGCNTAARELVREWPLHRRERQAGLSPAAYVLAKWAVLAAAAGGQVTLLYVVVSAGCHLPEAGGMLPILAAVSAAGVSAGLLASAVAASEATAVACVPLLVIPQIVLSEVFSPLTGWPKAAAEWLVTAHAGFGGLLAAQPPDIAALAGSPGISVRDAVVRLLVQAAVLGVAAWKVLELRGRPGLGGLPPRVRRLLGDTQ